VEYRHGAGRLEGRSLVGVVVGEGGDHRHDDSGQDQQGEHDETHEAEAVLAEAPPGSYELTGLGRGQSLLFLRLGYCCHCFSSYCTGYSSTCTGVSHYKYKYFIPSVQGMEEIG